MQPYKKRQRLKSVIFFHKNDLKVIAKILKIEQNTFDQEARYRLTRGAKSRAPRHPHPKKDKKKGARPIASTVWCLGRALGALFKTMLLMWHVYHLYLLYTPLVSPFVSHEAEKPFESQNKNKFRCYFTELKLELMYPMMIC